jgi:hypothetical protein
VGLLAEDIGLLNEKGSALRLGAATQLVVRLTLASRRGARRRENWQSEPEVSYNSCDIVDNRPVSHQEPEGGIP